LVRQVRSYKFSFYGLVQTMSSLESASRFAANDRIGPYSLLSFLGRGAFGEVWLAERDSDIAKSRLALKLPLRQVVDGDLIRKEAELWIRASNHPNVLPLFEANIYDGQVVFASEYAPTGSLKQWLDQHGCKCPSIESAVDIAMGILAGLEHIHIRGIIHRDLKPANVMIQGGIPRIADFGLARLINPGATVSMAAGTPAYMAPEAFEGQRSVRTDLWSVGVILYQLLDGRLPFPIDDLTHLMKAILQDDPLPLSSSMPTALQDAISTALAKKPEGRFATAADMRASLRDALKDSEIKRAPAPIIFRRGSRAISVTGSMNGDPLRTSHRVRSLLTPYCSDETTWYCGSVGVVDEAVITYLCELGQRVVVVGYQAEDIAPSIKQVMDRANVPFVDAQHEQVPYIVGAPTKRDVFFSTKGDLVVLFWNRSSRGTAALMTWLQTQGKDHLIGFV
jgi:serine/threonine protein kinase